MIEGPQQVAALGDAPMGVERASWRAIDGRMMSGIDRAATSATARKFQTWASYDYANEDITGTGLSTSGNINTIAVGGDMLVTDRILAGIAFSYSEYKGDLQQQRRQLQAEGADDDAVHGLRRRPVVCRRNLRRGQPRLQQLSSATSRSAR